MLRPLLCSSGKGILLGGLRIFSTGRPADKLKSSKDSRGGYARSSGSESAGTYTTSSDSKEYVKKRKQNWKKDTANSNPKDNLNAYNNYAYKKYSPVSVPRHP